MKITKLPYNNKHEKTPSMKIKSVKQQDIIGRKNRQEMNLLTSKKVRSRDFFTPPDFNEIGRVWTF